MTDFRTSAATLPPMKMPKDGAMFKAAWSRNGSLAAHEEGPPEPLGPALARAMEVARQTTPKVKSVTLLKEDDSHPDNKGKFFLDQIIK